MSEAWSNLLAALVGAIVGGAASLAGTVLVNRMQMATNARLRMYDELLPAFARKVDRSETATSGQVMLAAIAEADGALDALRRASAIAGRQERKAVHKLMNLWIDLQVARRVEGPTDLSDEVEVFAVAAQVKPPEEASYAKRKSTKLRSELEEEIQGLSNYLGAKLG